MGRFTPVLDRILREGVAGGELTGDDPEGTARVIVTVILGNRHLASRLPVARHAGEISFEEVVRSFAAFEAAIRRVPGIEAGRLSLTDPPTLRQWFA